MRETPAMYDQEGQRGGAAPLRSRVPRVGRVRGAGPGRLPAAILGHLRLAVAVVDASWRLVYWNEQAAGLFRMPPLLAAETPPLDEALAGIVHMTNTQRSRFMTFVAGHIARGDRAEPDSRLRLALTRDHKITVQVQGMGTGRWLVIIDDGRLSVPAGVRGRSMPGGGDAWLDALTGLGNRRQFNQVLRATLEGGSPDSRHAVVLIDLDRFTPVNDALGHPVGDALLCLVAQRLRRETREDDLLVRLGGDEFVLLIQNGGRAEVLVTRIIEILSRPFLVEGHIVNIGASAGVVVFSGDGTTTDELMQHVELALFSAKSAGRKTWRMFEPAMASQAKSKQSFETDLRRALTLGEFSIAYQAQLNIGTRSVTGFEALLRWNHPIRGSVPPVAFIPVAEEIGCIVGLGEWVLKTACKEAARWPEGLSVAVNVSPRQLEDSERLFKAVHAALLASGLPPERLELEITESSLLSREGHVLDTLRGLRASGIRIAMDDFGTGYSSLSQLLSFPFDKIKIDRSFIAGLGQHNDAAAVIRAISGLGAGLGMTTTAEGIETAEQAELVAADGCTDIQGYLIGRPVPADEIDALLGRYPPALEKVAVSV